MSLSGLGIRVMQVPLYKFGNVPSSLIFGENLRSIDINFFFNVWQNAPVKPFGPSCFFIGRFLMTDSISLLMGLSQALYLHDSVLVG